MPIGYKGYLFLQVIYDSGDWSVSTKAVAAGGKPTEGIFGGYFGEGLTDCRDQI